MSALLEQSFQPQCNFTLKLIGKPNKSGLSTQCRCGEPKWRSASLCTKCRVKQRRFPEDKNIYIVDQKPCRLIPLTKGQWTLVDSEDYDYLTQWSYVAEYKPKTNTYYATSYGAGCALARRAQTMAMTAVVLRLPLGTLIDHINGNSLDNRKSNLRVATHTQNMANRKRGSNNTSGYIGVSKVNKTKKQGWLAQVNKDRRCYTLGTFGNPIMAAKVRDKFALMLFGEFAKLNFPELIEQYLDDIINETGKYSPLALLPKISLVSE
jgi:hypothetical protein